MKKLKQFETVMDILKNMPPAHKAALIHNHQEFHRLQSLCQAKKEIEVLPNMAGIKVLKHCENVTALKAVVDFLKPGTFKWEDSQNPSPLQLVKKPII